MSLTLISCTRNTDSAEHKKYLRHEIAAIARRRNGEPVHFNNFTELFDFSVQPFGSRILRMNDILPIVEAQACENGNNCFDIVDYIRNLSIRLVRPIIICEKEVSHSYVDNKYLGERHNEIIAKGIALNYGIVCLEGDLDHKIQQIRALVPEQIEISLKQT